MGVIDDPIDQFCVDCGRLQPEAVLNCCNECEGWSCKPFTLDPDAEICDSCHEAAGQSRSERAFERRMNADNDATGVHYRQTMRDAGRGHLL